MSLNTGGIIGLSIAGGIIALFFISKVVHGNGVKVEETTGGTRHYRKGGTRKNRKR